MSRPLTFVPATRIPRVAVTDEGIAARWQALWNAPEGTLGHAVARMYDSRGFELPGTPGGASPWLAQHDFAHVIADYGTTLPSEYEVFAFIDGVSRNAQSHRLVWDIDRLFGTGTLNHAFGVFDANPSHRPSMERLVDAYRRGRRSLRLPFMGTDWHRLASVPLTDVREALGVTGKSVSDSPGVDGPGSRSEYQIQHSRI